MPTFFIIKELDSQYSWDDFEICDLAYDYAVDIHNIPESQIEEVEVFTKSRRVEITLLEDKTILNEDWYHCLLQYEP